MNKRRRLRHVGLASILLILMLVASSYGTTTPSFADEHAEGGDLPPEALDLTPDTFTQLQSTKDHNPKLDSVLVDLATQAGVSLQDATAVAAERGMRLVDNRIQVEVITHPDGIERAKQAVTDAGGEVTGTGFADTVIQAWLPLDALEVVAVQHDVDMIRLPAAAQPDSELAAGFATTEGLDVLNGVAWQEAGYTGDGVRIGIIDTGFLGVRALLGTDLPDSVFVNNLVDFETIDEIDGTTEHGTACAEIIHDIAPDATLYLAKVETPLDLDEAVSWLIAQDVDIISSSISYDNLTPGDGTDVFADLVRLARANDILWVTSAGNRRQEHWGGSYSDPDRDGFHNFNGPQEVNYFAVPLAAGQVIPLSVRWDDWTNVNQDYDLYVLRWNGFSWDIIAAGDNFQNGRRGQKPIERVTFVTFGATTYYGFIMVPYNATRRVNFEFFARAFVPFDEFVTARSISNLADAPDAMTVAALDVNYPFPQESYSSEGPTNGPGGTASGGFIKPDISAFANVSTMSYGTAGFNGTSSATPHVAGAAALVQSAFPDATPTQIQNFLENRAIDRGLRGMDTQFGYGQLYLGAPPGTPAVPFDFDGNGSSDIFWRNGLNGDNVFWLNGAQTGSVVAGTATDTAVGVGDFNFDGRADILWRNRVNGRTAIWFMDGETVLAVRFLRRVTDPAWDVVAVDDFNGDGYADIFWRNRDSGWNYVWLMRNNRIFLEGYVGWAPVTWDVAGTGNFDDDDDSTDDILWRNSVSGRNFIWLMNSSVIPVSVQLSQVSDLAWEVVGTGDLDGSGTDDILWRNTGSGVAGGWTYAWLMDEGRIAAGNYLGWGTASWRIVHTGDFDGNFTSDIFWRNLVTGDNYVWYMRGLQVGAEEGWRPISTLWGIVGAGRFEGDRVPVASTADGTVAQAGSVPSDPEGGEASPPPNDGQDPGAPPAVPDVPDSNPTPPEAEPRQPSDDLSIPPPAATDDNGVRLTGPSDQQIFLPLLQN